MALLNQSRFYTPATSFALQNDDGQFASDFTFSIPTPTTGFTLEWDSIAQWVKIDVTTVNDFSINMQGFGINLSNLNNPGNVKIGAFCGRFSLGTAFKPSWLSYDLEEPTAMNTLTAMMAGKIGVVIVQFDGDQVKNLTKLSVDYDMEFDSQDGVLPKSAMVITTEESTIAIDQ